MVISEDTAQKTVSSLSRWRGFGFHGDIQILVIGVPQSFANGEIPGIKRAFSRSVSLTYDLRALHTGLVQESSVPGGAGPLCLPPPTRVQPEQHRDCRADRECNEYPTVHNHGLTDTGSGLSCHFTGTRSSGTATDRPFSRRVCRIRRVMGMEL